MVNILSENPILLLFIVASLGYFLGSIKVRGNSLGVAAILFTGLAFGALDPDLNIPEIILLLGLSIFVYAVGLNSGPAFFESYRKNGMRDFSFIVMALLFSGLIAVTLWSLFGFSAAAISGIYAGSTTNTAALAGVIDLINNSAIRGNQAAGLIEDVVVGYSFSYPMGVLGGIIAILLLEKWLKIDYQQEKLLLKKDFPLDEGLTNAAVEIDNPAIAGHSLRDIMKDHSLNVVFGRLISKGTSSLANWDVVLNKGDTVLLVGSEEEVEHAIDILGKKGDPTLTYDRSLFDNRRIFVSNHKLAGRSIASLNLQEKYNAVFTRIRRGDIDMLARPETVLEIGDRIRFVARREDLRELSDLFGDSYQATGKINLFSFGLGIGLGLVLGTLEFSIGQLKFTLGYAGGPLVVGLILGALRRSGPIVWTLPYSANITLQQIGLILLLSAIGVRSGNAFIQSLSLDGLFYFLASTVISLLTAFFVLIVGYKIVKIPFTLLTGMVSNQPAILDVAVGRAGNNIPSYGFSMMFPIALILKILIAQIIFAVLS